MKETVAALVIWGLALTFPFRKMVANIEWRWDILAVIAASVFSYVAYSGLVFVYELGGSFLDPWYVFVASWPLFVQVVVYVLMADMLAYWGHRLLHTKAFWHTHAFHHSPQHLYVLSGVRASFVHITVLFAGPLAVLFLVPIYEAPLVFVLFAWLPILNQHYIHSNLRFPLASYLEYVFVTPRFHFVHHSVDRRFSDNNFGFLLSIWDRLFGTYMPPEAVAENEPLGLDYANSKLRLLAGLPPPK